MTNLKFSGPAPTPPGKGFFPHLSHIVTVDRCYYYLNFLERFWTYYDTLTLQEQRYYLARAEVRYEKWIFNFTIGITTPPIDIAFMWHIHILSPSRYYEDMVLRFDRETVFDEQFSLGGLRMTSDGPTEDTLAQWKKVFGDDEPYTLTVENMYDGTYKRPCYNCDDDIELPWKLYADHRYGITNTPFPHDCCPSKCINFLDIARMKLVGDLTRKGGRGPTVAGTLLKLNGTEKSHVNKMISKIKPIKEIVPQNEMDTAYERQIQELLKFLGPSYEYDANELLYAIRTSYQGNPTPFSIDLIHGVARHRRFYEAIMDIDWKGYEGFASSIRRYHDFLAELSTSTRRKAVPTLEIDVSFHVHMLCAKAYRKFMLKYLHRVVNHDDNIPASDIECQMKRWERRDANLNYGFKETRRTDNFVEGVLYVCPEFFQLEFYPGMVMLRKGQGSSDVIKSLNYKLTHPTQSRLREVSVHSQDVNRSLSAYPSLSDLNEVQNFIAEGAKRNGYGYIGSINRVSGGNSALKYQENRKSKDGRMMNFLKSRLKEDIGPMENSNVYVVNKSIGSMRTKLPNSVIVDQDQEMDALPSYFPGDGERPPGYAFDSQNTGETSTQSGRRLYLQYHDNLYSRGLDDSFSYTLYAATFI
ncbi:hypothetical protein BCR42DRAFT_406977 [Absidia repens]|uniref:Uncharacterized protein n=1 Tax=Absidia repens TaxID=90262 RepID=A0A1X2IRM6_9FUNG|nr:hypothetical protein BCR42DRAFT_406977 [Absidia repens]